MEIGKLFPLVSSLCLASQQTGVGRQTWVSLFYPILAKRNKFPQTRLLLKIETMCEDSKSSAYENKKLKYLLQKVGVTRKVLLQCPQETRAPAGWGSGLAGPGWTGPRLIILLLKDTQGRHTRSLSMQKVLQMVFRKNSRVSSSSLGYPGAANRLRVLIKFIHYLTQLHSSRITDQTVAKRSVCFSQHVWLWCKTARASVNSLEYSNLRKCAWRNERITFGQV